MRPSAYVICATPRSGSTLLCDLLTASGAGRPHSYFPREDIDYWADQWRVAQPVDDADPAFDRAYVAAMGRAGRGSPDLFGLRLMWGSVGEAARRLNRALGDAAQGFGDARHHADFTILLERAFGPTLFIHLSREDKAAQAASLVRAEQSGLWHVHADGSERERVAPPAAPVFDRDRLTRARDRLRHEMRLGPSSSTSAGWSRCG